MRITLSPEELTEAVRGYLASRSTVPLRVEKVSIEGRRDNITGHDVVAVVIYQPDEEPETPAT